MRIEFAALFDLCDENFDFFFDLLAWPHLEWLAFDVCQPASGRARCQFGAPTVLRSSFPNEPSAGTFPGPLARRRHGHEDLIELWLGNLDSFAIFDPIWHPGLPDHELVVGDLLEQLHEALDAGMIADGDGMVLHHLLKCYLQPW